MSRDASAHRPTIAPVPAGVARPAWSVMIPTYHCAGYLRQTLATVLSQDPCPDAMQIEVVDDASTQDDPEAVVRELGGGRVAVHRQSRNVGYVRNFETCLQRSRGRVVHLLHGDDFVREGFYQRLGRAFDGPGPKPGAAFCRHVYLDDRDGSEALSPLERPDAGVIDGWLERIAGGQRIATPSIVVRREVYEELGGFDRRFTCAGEDWEMWVRIATRYSVWFEPEPLAVYRVRRAGSLTDASSRTSRLVADMRLATRLIEAYLPRHLPTRRARDLTRHARRTYARWAIEAAAEAAASRAPLARVLGPLREALRCSRSRQTLREAAGVLAGACGRRVTGRAATRASAPLEEGRAQP